MKNLSERLGRVIDILEADGDEHNVTEVIFEGFKLALAVEAAPVADAKHYSRPPMRAVTGIYVEGADVWPLAGKRVRIVPEREG